MSEDKKVLINNESDLPETDHRNLGLKLQLFHFEGHMAPGSCFWLPHGTVLYNKLMDVLRLEYRQRGFDEVITPNLYSSNLFKISGHYQNYKDCMFSLECEGEEMNLKPMNCPGHCLLFKQMNVSYRQLPLRLADFGVLHRNELSGALSGLTRVRRFQQDDAHIFCSMDQVQSEVVKSFDFLFKMYKLAFRFEFKVGLSTRPAKALGEKSLWDDAEKSLLEAIKSTGLQYDINEGDGAFYGPKIDIHIKDALERWTQCATIQLDFQLPLRFNLTYKAAGGEEPTEEAPKHTQEEIDHSKNTDMGNAAGPTEAVLDAKAENDFSLEEPLKPGYERPVIIHRAVLGSVERMAAILLEHFGGRFPFWLNVRQIGICPISSGHHDKAFELHKHFKQLGYQVEVNATNKSVPKRIRELNMLRTSYIICIGDAELTGDIVTVTSRDDAKHRKTAPLADFEAFCAKLSDPFLTVDAIKQANDEFFA